MLLNATKVIKSMLNICFQRSPNIPRYVVHRCKTDFAKFTEYKPVKKIRNIGIFAHIGSGKTTLMERILHYTGRIEREQEVKGKDNLGATKDSREFERQRGLTIECAATYTLWKDHNINIIDTPGHVDFSVEVERALRVLDGAILVLCAVRGVQNQSLTVNRQMKRYNVPCLAFINKLDRTGADPYRTLSQMKTKMNHNAAFLQIPIGIEANCNGIIDLVHRKAIYFEGNFENQIKYDIIPKNMIAESEHMRRKLIKHVSSVDHVLGKMRTLQQKITENDIKGAIRRTCLKRTFTPVLVGTALKNKGVQSLLDAVLEYLPNPSEVKNYAFKEKDGCEPEKVLLNPDRKNDKGFIALAFKLESGKFGQLTYFRCYQGMLQKGENVYNVRTQKSVRVSRLVRLHSNNLEDMNEVHAGDIFALFKIDCASGDTFVTDPKMGLSLESIVIPKPIISMCINPTNNKDKDKFCKAIASFTKENPTLHFTMDKHTKKTIVSGMGELHLEVYAQRIESEYDCPVVLGKPKVAFRETLVSPCNFDYLHKKQSEGQDQYARVTGVLEPLSSQQNSRLEFRDETVGTNVPKEFIPAIRRGFLAMTKKGLFCGHKMTGLLFRLQDGAHHSVDSSELAFYLAAQGAIREVFKNGTWQILEPIMRVETTAPVEFQQDIVTQLKNRNGNVTWIERNEIWFTLYAEVPLNAMFGYGKELKSDTKGKGEFSMEFYKYSPCLPQVQNLLIEEYEKNIGIVPNKNEKK